VTRAVGGNNGGGASGGANTGSGGAGSTGSVQGNGGSGVVIIRHPDTIAQATTTGSPTVTTSGGNRIYVFNNSGSITW
jgi:hypothetical protein